MGKRLLLAVVVILGTAAHAAAQDGPPSCDTSPETYAECAALAGVSPSPEPTVEPTASPQIVMPNTAMQ